MAFSSSSMFLVLLTGSALSPSSNNDKLENSEEGVVATGLVKWLVLPDLDDGVVPLGLKLRGGLTISSFGLIHCLLSWSLEVCFFCVASLVNVASCAAAAAAGLLSDGPVKRCTISLNMLVSVWTNVVMGLQVATFWLPWLFIGFTENDDDDKRTKDIPKSKPRKQGEDECERKCRSFE